MKINVYIIEDRWYDEISFIILSKLSEGQVFNILLELYKKEGCTYSQQAREYFNNINGEGLVTDYDKINEYDFIRKIGDV